MIMLGGVTLGDGLGTFYKKVDVDRVFRAIILLIHTVLATAPFFMKRSISVDAWRKAVSGLLLGSIVAGRKDRRR